MLGYPQGLRALFCFYKIINRPPAGPVAIQRYIACGVICWDIHRVCGNPFGFYKIINRPPADPVDIPAVYCLRRNMLGYPQGLRGP